MEGNLSCCFDDVGDRRIRTTFSLNCNGWSQCSWDPFGSDGAKLGVFVESGYF